MSSARVRANGQTEVTTYEPSVYAETSDGTLLSEIRVSETFSGDVAGEGTVRVIQAARRDKSATFVGIERVEGTVHGRKGSFLLQVSGTVVDKEMKAEWFVVPASGTAELNGLRGEGGFTAQLGQHGLIWLDYYFESADRLLRSSE